MSQHYSEERRRQILVTLRCPSCGAQNKPNAKAMIELDAEGLGYCNSCGSIFVVDPPKES